MVIEFGLCTHNTECLGCVCPKVTVSAAISPGAVEKVSSGF